MATKPPQKENFFSRTFSNREGSSSIPATQLVSKDLPLAALISKLTVTNDPIEKQLENTDGRTYLDQGQLQVLSESIKSRIKDNENILKLFPDIELAIQIMVSSVLSPKDMMAVELLYNTIETLFPSDIQSKLNVLIQELFEKHYPIKNDLSQILRDMMFEKGSVVKMVLPENILDEIINDELSLSQESMNILLEKDSNDKLSIKPLGFLGDKPDDSKLVPSLENLLIHRTQQRNPYTSKGIYIEDKVELDHIEVVDNFNVIKMPEIKEAHRRKVAMESIVNISSKTGTARTVEGIYFSGDDKTNKKMSRREFTSLVFKNKPRKIESVVTIGDPANAKRKSVTRPILKNIPSEACIPVCVPGDEKNHVGYFLLVDIDGNFVTTASMSTSMDNLASMISNNSTSDVNSSLLQKAASNLSLDKKALTLDHVSKFYTTVVVRNLVDKLRHGRYKSELSVSLNEEVANLMLARGLAAKFTRMVYVPKELITYFTLKYDINGVGLSYLDEIKMLTSVRGILLFAKVMGRVKNSINITNVKMKFDPRDPDPDLTAEQAMDEILKMRRQMFPFGINSMPDLADWVQRAGLQFTFEGHPDFPDMNFEFTNSSAEHKLPDDDFDESLRKQTYMAFGLTPEILDEVNAPDFATTVANNSLMFSKRAATIQEQFKLFITDLARKIMTHDPEFKKDVFKIFDDHKALLVKELSEEQVKEFNEDQQTYWMALYDAVIENTTISLPKPDETTVKAQSESFETYKTFITSAVDTVISNDFMPADMIGQWADKLDVIKSAFISHLLRQWLSNNNCLPELFDIITKDDNDNPNLKLSDVYKVHFEALAASALDFIKDFIPLKITTNETLKRIDDALSTEGMPTDDVTGNEGGGGTEESTPDTSAPTDSFGDDKGFEEEPT